MLYSALLIISVTCSQAAHLRTLPVPTYRSEGSESRIIGSNPVPIESYPYIVQVTYEAQLWCGGVLVTPRHVVSVANPFTSILGGVYDPRLYNVRAGTAAPNTGGSIHDVSRIIIHELYKPLLRNDDIAVLLLSTPALGTTIGLARMPTQNAVVPDNATVTHVSWGYVTTSASILYEAQTRTVNQLVCAEQHLVNDNQTGNPIFVTEQMICTNISQISSLGSCSSYVGGPLIHDSVVVGISFWGYGCGDPSYPGLSTRVAGYTNWIEDTVTRYNAGSPLGSVSGLLLLLSALTTGVTKMSYL